MSTMLASLFGPVGLANLKRAKWKNLPRLVEASPTTDIRFLLGELKDVRLRKGYEQALMWKKKKLSDILDFSSPQGRRLVTAYPGIDKTPVTNEKRSQEDKDTAGGYDGGSKSIWLNPDHPNYKDPNALYKTILHEGINHAIWAREPSFPKRVVPYDKLTDLGYAMDLEEVLVDLASRRGAERAASKKGSADALALSDGIIPHIQFRLSDKSPLPFNDGSLELGITSKEELPVIQGAEESEKPEEPVPIDDARLPRQAAKGGESESGDEVTDSIDSVNSESAADTPVMSGPRIVINPSTFRNRKDALCVAFNERFRIAMEQYGFEPQSEPTPKQRRFFADTAYADDEVQLRRTILARILTLDTSVKDPTDEQLAEAGEFLQAFKEREQPSNDWEAAAVDRIAELVAAVKPAGRPPAAPRTKGSTQADVGGGTPSILGNMADDKTLTRVTSTTIDTKTIDTNPQSHLFNRGLLKSHHVDNTQSADGLQTTGSSSGSSLSPHVNWMQATPVNGVVGAGDDENPNSASSGLPVTVYRSTLVNADFDGGETEQKKREKQYSNPDSDTTKAFLERQKLTAIRKGIGRGDQQAIQAALKLGEDAEAQAQANPIIARLLKNPEEDWLLERKRNLAEWATNYIR